MSRVVTILAAAAMSLSATLPATAQITAEQCIAAGGTVVNGFCQISQAQAEAAGLTDPATAGTPPGTGEGFQGTGLAAGGAILLLALAIGGGGTTTTAAIVATQ